MIQNTKTLVYVSASGVSVTRRTLLLQARTKVEGGKGPHILGISCRKVIQRMALCISTAIVTGVVRCFSLIFESNEEFELSMLTSAGKGRAEI